MLTLLICQFYFVMFLCYVVVGTAWGWLSYRHIQELFSLQVSSLSLRFGKHAYSD